MNSDAEPTSTKPLSPEELQDQEDRAWLRDVYQGDKVKQLSVRSIVAGMMIGAVMSISNLYIGLKTGWGFGVTITACIIAYAVFKFLETIIPAYRRNPFTILENYTMSSAASAAGYTATAGLVSAIPALYLTSGIELSAGQIMLWMGFVSVLGVFMAVPLKRQMINIDKLPFPSGIATAETLRSMHTSGVEAMQKAKSLFIGGIIGAVNVIWKDGLPPVAEWLGTKQGDPELTDKIMFFSLPEAMSFFKGDKYGWLEKYSIGFDGSLLFVSAGALMGMRVGASLLIGAVVFYGMIGPYLLEHNTTGPNYGKHGINYWTLWPATAMMVSSGLLSFAFRWRTIVRAFGNFTKVLRGHSKAEDPLAHVEVPTSWFVIGTAISGYACVEMGHQVFGIDRWLGVVAVLLTFLLSIVAARATGETDFTPIGAMGKITQLMFAVISPSSITPGFMTKNLMSASITAAVSTHSADLLTDLKSGHLLGGSPRKQTISQLFGVLAGTLVCVPVYALVVHDPKQLGTDALPAPSAMIWASVAQLLAKGIESLPQGTAALIIGGVIGIVLTLAEEYTPKKYHGWIPSCTGLGVAGVISAHNSISMFLGALFVWVLEKFRRDIHERHTVPFSSGLIAGESLMGIVIIFILQGPKMVSDIWQQISQTLHG